MEVKQGEFEISTDLARLQLNEIHRYLSRSYWASGRSLETVRSSTHNSLCFGLYHGPRQVGFARVISDKATFAYLCDVYVLEDYQGQGLGKWLMSVVVSHPELQNLRRFVLATRDAHGLYEQFGFVSLQNADRWMEIFKP